ncbi:unnamed protein product [Rotaria socialis]|uniref:Thioredoxin peroxidase n=1 Tax=Rotaria socialis TaxID=392032 RepID=A0A820KFZ4_9BILA|nr:unnamed protein product [Rotaria socialis]CAF3471363.1 unnamed protein product [Rotaria socialis]CAF3605265.1 unnamed protein product [Rotaria socialis]CAF3632443.1 unnamed protein product [Rotaria socialis]CAF3802642.1 unnamed protein product [Rotaria socialis]
MYRQFLRQLTSFTIKTPSYPFQNVVARMTTYHSSFPAIAKPAPEFKGQAVIKGHFKDIQLSDYKGKYVVLFFYPLDFTFVCPTELVAFNDRIDEFRNLNTQVIGCSTDSVHSHLAWINTPRKKGGLGGLKYPLLSDFSKEITRRYGILIDDNGGIALRGLFIIDKEHILRQITINDLPVGRSVDETLRLIKALQYVEQYGEVCPADWNEKTNPHTIKPDPVKSKEYFDKQE